MNTQNESTLADWWNQLNSWKWPKELGWEEPISLNTPIRCLIMTSIQNRIGYKACLKSGTEMSDSEFDDFWLGNYCGDKKALDRYKIYQDKKYYSL